MILQTRSGGLETMERTLEQRLKFDHGLTIGRHVVEIALGQHSRRAIAEISPRGKVYLLFKPRDTDMYSSWRQVKGDILSPKPHGSVIVWGARDPSLMQMFDGAAIKIEIKGRRPMILQTLKNQWRQDPFELAGLFILAASAFVVLVGLSVLATLFAM